MRENKFTRNLRDDLELAGAIVVPMIANSMAHGWPDRIIWHPLWCGWAEFKGDNTVVRRQQVLNMEAINLRRPGTAVVIRAPNLVLSPTGELLFTFDNAKDLLTKLGEACSTKNSQ